MPEIYLADQNQGCFLQLSKLLIQIKTKEESALTGAKVATGGDTNCGDRSASLSSTSEERGVG